MEKRRWVTLQSLVVLEERIVMYHIIVLDIIIKGVRVEVVNVIVMGEIQCANKCGNLTVEGSEYCEVCEYMISVGDFP
jgi:hypothetical protein